MQYDVNDRRYLSVRTGCRITFTGGTSLNKYLDIIDNHPIVRISDNIMLNYDAKHFKTGAIDTDKDKSYNLELNNIMGKVQVKDRGEQRSFL